MTYECFCGSKLEETRTNYTLYLTKKKANIPFPTRTYHCLHCNQVYFSDEQMKSALDKIKNPEARQELLLLYKELYEDSITRIERFVRKNNMAFHYLQSHVNEKLEDWEYLLKKSLENLPVEHKPENIETLIKNDMEYLLQNHPETVENIIRKIGVSGLLTLVAENTCVRISSKLKESDIRHALNTFNVNFIFFHTFYDFRYKLARYLKVDGYDLLKLYERIKDSLKSSEELTNYPFNSLDHVVYKFLKDDKNLKQLKKLLTSTNSTDHGIIAPVIYISSILIGRRISQIRTADASNITPLTLQKKYKKIMENFHITIKL